MAERKETMAKESEKAYKETAGLSPKQLDAVSGGTVSEEYC